MTIETIMLHRVAQWIETTGYKLPEPSGPEVREIRVLVRLAPRVIIVDCLVFDAISKKLLYILLDVENFTNSMVKRVDFVSS